MRILILLVFRCLFLLFARSIFNFSSSSRTFTANAKEVVTPPGRPLIVAFTSRSVNLSWAPSPSKVAHYLLNVRVGEESEWGSDALGVRTPDNRTTFEVTGLEPYTVYSFRVKGVTNTGLMSIPSKESYYIVTLREVPDGPPVITSCMNESSSSIRLTWNPPPSHTIHGEFLGYKIKCRQNGDNNLKPIPMNEDLEEKDFVLRNPDAKSYVIQGLKTFTEYTVSIQAFNPAGEGPAASVVIMTDEGVPSAPLNVTLVRVADSLVKLKWEEPQNPNGIIRGYHVYILNIAQNYTDVKKVINPSRSMEFTANNLKPFTSYKIWVKAFTWKQEGESSRMIEIRTDVQGPTAPYIVNLTCSSLDSIYLQWERPNSYYNKIDYYFVYYRPENSWEFEEIALSASRDQIDHEILIANLTADTLYEVKVQGASRSIIEHSRIYRGEFSQPRKVVLQSKCESYVASPYQEQAFNASILAGVICASFAILLAAISFLLWRKYFQAAYYYLDDPPSVNGQHSQSQEDFSFIDSEYSSVPVTLWSKHVQDLHADGDIGFSREYEAIQNGCDIELACEHSQSPENKHKNRYVNIVAYDHSRVVLKQLPGISNKKSHNDYINANYIDGYCKPRAYIGTQGPLPATFEDYWRMIWEQRVCIIVMITNLVERGRRKCDMYWPKEGSETYGIITVKLLQEVVMATYILRTFTIRNSKVKKKHGCERTVYQYHYTNWPDHGVPDHPLPVLSFVRKSAAANPPTAGPIIVHCSAGVGRTGTYIVIDAMMKQIKHRQSLNAFGFLKHIRSQRNYLVQTEEQYIFIHDALLEAIESGDTEVPSSHLSRYIQTLQTGGDSISDNSSNLEMKFGIGCLGSTDIPILSSSNSMKSMALTATTHSSQWPLLERQYKLVISFRAKDFNVVSALKPCNKGKNRSLNLIPLEAHRVHITPRCPGTDGCDYINATFLPGFNHLKEFIVTQHPVTDTIHDFWQMVWDHNSTTIVMLSHILDEKDFPQFWPETESEDDYGSFKVKLIQESTMYQEAGGYITTRDFIIQSTQDDYELTCKLIHCPSWPESCGPLSAVFDLIKVVQDWTLDQSTVGPVIVVDRYGGTEAATFCCLTTLYKQLNFEDCVDVYMYSKLYHLRRPGVWRSQDDYLYLYRAMESLVSTMSISENNDAGSSAFGSQLTVTNGSGHMTGNGHAVKISLSEGQMITNSIPASITTATLQPHHATKNLDPIV